MNEIVLKVSNLDVSYQLSGKRVLKAVQNVTFELKRGETIGIVGESGCGKSSLVKAIAQLPKPPSGQVPLNGVNLGGLNSRNLRESRKSFPIVFQDPISSLNPRRTALQLVAQPLKIQKFGNAKERTEMAIKMLEKVGISAELHGRRPYELSGGQYQRVSIARALVTGPSILICDEPVSALDVSVQAQILNLLEDLKQEFQLSILFVSHDLGVVKSISDRVMVMYLGKVAELADANEIYGNPQHPYTKLLLESIPGSNKGRVRPVRGVGIDLPSPLNPPSGCAFSSRCAFVLEHCRVEEPKLQLIDKTHKASCPLTAKPVSAKA